MKRLVAFALALLFTFVVSTAPAIAGGSSARKVDRSYFGMHVPGVAWGSHPSNTGITSIRLWDSNTAWANIEKAPGEYDWTLLDKAVETAHANGDSVMLVLGGTPRFYAENPDFPSPYGAGFCSNADLSAWSRYVTAVVNRYKGRIQAYEPINEVDITMFYCGASTPHIIERSKRVYNIVQRIDPAAVVATPSFVDRTVGSQYQLVNYLKAGGYKWAEVISYHPYGMPEYGPEQNANLVSALYKKTARWNLPIWSTEINYGLPFGEVKADAEPWSEWKQSSYLVRTYILQNDVGARRVYWYSWSAAGFLGVKMTDSGASKALESVKWWLRGRIAPCETDRKGTYTCRIYYKGQDGYVRWNPSKTVRKSIPARVTTKRNMYGNLVPLTKTVGGAPVLYR